MQQGEEDVSAPTLKHPRGGVLAWGDPSSAPLPSITPCPGKGAEQLRSKKETYREGRNGALLLQARYIGFLPPFQYYCSNSTPACFLFHQNRDSHFCFLAFPITAEAGNWRHLQESRATVSYPQPEQGVLFQPQPSCCNLAALLWQSWEPRGE